MKNLNEPTKRDGNFKIGDKVEARGFFGNTYSNNQKKLEIIHGTVKNINSEKVLINSKIGEILIDSYKVSKLND